MTNVTKAIAACVGSIALACAAVPPANAADMPPQYPQSQYQQYGGPPVVQERYVQQERYAYPEQPQPYYQPAPPPVVYQEYAPPAVVPEPYYVPPRRVYVAPGYGPYAYGPRPYYGRPYYGPRAYVARGYGYDRPYRRW